MSTRAKIGLTLVMTLTVLFGFVVVLYLYTDWGNEQIRYSVAESLKTENQRVHIGRVGDFKLFSPFGAIWATAEDVSVTRGSDEIFAVGEVTVALEISALLSRTLHFREMRIEGAEIPVDKKTGLPKVAVPPRRKAFEPSEWDARFDNVSLGLYLIDTGENGERAIAGRMHGELSAKIPGDVPGVQITLRKARGILSQPEAIQVLDASGKVDTSAVTVADIRFSAIARGAAVTGSVAYIPSDPEYPIQPNIENVRDAGMMNNPMETLKGMGLDLPMDALKKFGMPVR